MQRQISGAASRADQERYSRANVLPWYPLMNWQSSALPDYTVDCEAKPDSSRIFNNLQEAIDCAVRDNSNEAVAARTIQIKPGFYVGPVYVPRSAPPLTIVGAGLCDVVLAARIDAQMPGREYESRFADTFQRSHSTAREIFAGIAAREHINTCNAYVLRIEADDFCLSGVTIRNDYACDRRSAAPSGQEPDAMGRYSKGQHQAVAVHVVGAHRVSFDHVKMVSFQDTLYLQSGLVCQQGEVSFANCKIEGDVDFIFGGMKAYFENCEICTRGERGALSWALAPSTNLHAQFGFVFNQCRFTHDGAETGLNGGSFLGRQWFEGVRATPYGSPNISGYRCAAGDVNHLNADNGIISRKTLEAVGKVTLIDCLLGEHIAKDKPWDNWGANTWTPRFRPVQQCAGDFLHFLEQWLEENYLNYAVIDQKEQWLQILNSSKNH